MPCSCDSPVSVCLLSCYNTMKAETMLYSSMSPHNWHIRRHNWEINGRQVGFCRERVGVESRRLEWWWATHEGSWMNPSNCVVDFKSKKKKFSWIFESEAIILWNWNSGGGLATKSCLALPPPVCQAPLSVGILQARILEWVAISFSMKSRRGTWLENYGCVNYGLQRTKSLWDLGAYLTETRQCLKEWRVKNGFFTKSLNVRCSRELLARVGSSRIPVCILRVPKVPNVCGFD